MKDPAFLFYDGDAARDVSHMNRLERGCYFDLIQAQRKFGRMPVDLIKKILGHEFETCWESVKICLSYDNDMYFIEWLENSTIKRKEYSESRRKNRMAEKQEDKEIISESYDNHMENENEIVIESKKEIVSVNNYTADFLKFWEAYPLKEGKKPAFEKWKKAKGKPDIETLIAKIEMQKKSEKWQKGFIPMPETYISKARWDDEVSKPKILRPDWTC